MALARKQQIMLVIIVIAFAFVLWQLYDIFGFGNSSTAPSTSSQPTSELPSAIPTATLAAEKPTVTSVGQTEDQIAQSATRSTANPPSRQTAADSDSQAQVSAPATPAASANGQLVQQPVQETLPLTTTERQYLNLADQLQLLKMQRQIIEQQEAIAQARKKLGELGVGSTVAGDMQTVSAPPRDLNLMYLDYQEGRWTATINFAGRFYEVENGTTLADGSKVSRIDRNGVVLIKNGSSNLLSFSGLMPLPQTPPLPEAAPYAPKQPMGMVQPRKPSRSQQSPSSLTDKAAEKKPSTTPALAPITLPAKKIETQEQAAPMKSTLEAVKKQQPAAETKVINEKPPMTTNSPAAVIIPEKKIKTPEQTSSVKPVKPNEVTVQNSQSSNTVKASKSNGKKTAAKSQSEQSKWVMVTPTTQASRQADNYQQLMSMLNGANDKQQGKQHNTPKTAAVTPPSNAIRLTAKEAQTFAELEALIAENNQANKAQAKKH